MFTAPDLGVINLVADHPHVVFKSCLRNGFNGLSGIDYARWVVGGVDQQAARAACGRQIRCGWLKAVVRLNRHGARDRTNRADRAGIRGVIGLDIGGGVAFVAARVVGCKQGGLATGGDQNVVAGRGDTCPRADPCSNCIAQWLGAWYAGIARVTALGAFVHGGQNAWVRADVMFTNGEVCDFSSSGFERTGAVQKRPSIVAVARQGANAV